MLSAVKRRLLYSIFSENPISSSLARFSSRKGPKEPFVSQQVSKPDSDNGGLSNDIFDDKVLPKKSKSKTADKYSDVFDAVLDATIGPNKTQRTRNSTTKPGQLNIKMVKAANNVADMARHKKKDVLEDIMGKLNSVFPGMEHHVKGKRKNSWKDKKKADQKGISKLITEEDKLRDIVSKSFGQSFSKRDHEENVLHDVLRDISPQRDGFRSAQMQGKPFKCMDKLLKSQVPLGVFSSQQVSPGSSLSMWEIFEKAQLENATKFEPLNWFDQCIAWTEEGKLWHFPIDNEQGMDKEAEVDFSEHIFLDHHADPWCPKEGPIKYFMELVLVGLSKNPFLTVQEKKDTIDWYRDYFLKNQSLLEEINAFGTPQNPIEVEGKIP